MEILSSGILVISSLHENFLNLLASRTRGLSEFTGPQWFLQAPIKYIIKSFIKTKRQSDFLIISFYLPDLKFTGLGLRTSGFSRRLNIFVVIHHLQIWHIYNAFFRIFWTGDIRAWGFRAGISAWKTMFYEANFSSCVPVLLLQIHSDIMIQKYVFNQK
jgi:hypothetical protein